MKTIDDAAIAAIYGSVAILSMLMVLDPLQADPLITAASLFVTVFAMALTEVFAETSVQALRTGERVTWERIKEKWRRSRVVIAAANGPTLAMLFCAVGLYHMGAAFVIARILAISLLIFYGARIGYRVNHTRFASVVGGAVTGGIGLFLSFVQNIMK